MKTEFRLRLFGSNVGDETNLTISEDAPDGVKIGSDNTAQKSRVSRLRSTA